METTHTGAIVAASHDELWVGMLLAAVLAIAALAVLGAAQTERSR